MTAVNVMTAFKVNIMNSECMFYCKQMRARLMAQFMTSCFTSSLFVKGTCQHYGLVCTMGGKATWAMLA